MKKFFALSFLLMFVSSANAVSFSPLEMIQKESQNDSAGVLSSVLDAYNPEDFITCEITGSPEVVRDKANTFRVNAEIKFDTEKYYSRFIPEITNALDKLSDKSRKTSGYLLELYDNGTFGPKYYSFNANNTERVSELLSKFRRKALRVKGIMTELQDSGMKTLHKITNELAVQYFIFEASEGSNKSVWTISPIIVNFTDNKRTMDSKIVIPVEFVIPDSILPNVRNIKASLFTEGTETVRRQGFFGAAVTDARSGGAMINRVVNGGAAEKAGLKKGDVILSLNGESVINGATFAGKIGTFYEGDELVMIINRDGKSYNVRITLGARP